MSASVINGKSTLFCGGLSVGVDEELVSSIFIPFGDLVKIQIPLDSDTGNHKGFAFVEFEDPNDCKAAIDNMNLSELNGKILRVQLARPGKYAEISSKAVWDEEEFIKDKSKVLEGKLEMDAAAGEEKQALADQQMKKKLKTSFKEHNANPQVFFDITMDKVPLGRIVFELFKDTTPKTAEKY